MYDANVLYPVQMRDFLMRLALGELFRAHWSKRIHEEWTENVRADYPDITGEDLRRVRSFMDKAPPGASVTGHEDRIEDHSLPDPSDRHVLAVAIHARADFIVTFNVRDFPASKLRTWDIEAVDPDELVSGLWDEAAEAIVDVASAHRQSLRSPSKSPEEYLDLLRGCGLEGTARLLEEYRVESSYGGGPVFGFVPGPRG